MNSASSIGSDPQRLRLQWEGTSDEAIVTRVLRGEPALFEVLMRRHNQRLFRAARSIVKSDDEAEDVMQEAYVQAFGHLVQFEARAKFSTWLTRIAVHEALARVRKRRPQIEHDEETSLSSMPSPEEDVSLRELSRLLEPLVDALPEAFRVVFVLRALEGMSAVEVADCLGIPEETVRTRYFRARRELQLHIEQQVKVSGPELYAFHLVRCDRVVNAVLARVLRTPSETPT